jgi:hydrogenase maturation protease HycI
VTFTKASTDHGSVQVINGPDLKEAISRRLAGADTVVICAVGNDFRGDDGVGILAGNMISESNLLHEEQVLICGELPENYLSEIVSLKPSHVVLLDAASVGREPGTIVIIEHDELYGGAISTHRLPLSFLARMISAQSGREVDVFILAIQVGRCDFAGDVSPPVARAAEALAGALVGALSAQRD